MPEVVESFARLQYELVRFAMTLSGDASHESVVTTCEHVWNHVQGNRSGHAAMTFDDFKLLFEATLDRCKAIVSPSED